MDPAWTHFFRTARKDLDGHRDFDDDVRAMTDAELLGSVLRKLVNKDGQWAEWGRTGGLTLDGHIRSAITDEEAGALDRLFAERLSRLGR